MLDVGRVYTDLHRHWVETSENDVTERLRSSLWKTQQQSNDGTSRNSALPFRLTQHQNQHGNNNFRTGAEAIVRKATEMFLPLHRT